MFKQKNPRHLREHEFYFEKKKADRRSRDTLRDSRLLFQPPSLLPSVSTFLHV